MNQVQNEGMSNCSVCEHKKSIVPTNKKFMVDCDIKGLKKTCHSYCKEFKLRREKDPEPAEKKIDLLGWVDG